MAEKLYQRTMKLPPKGATSANCSACRAPVPEDSRFCPRCGAPLSSSPAAADSGPSKAAALLSEANLLRIRGEWADAEAKCIEVMRADADNHSAYSLIGDIYRDQAKLEEAAQWYQLALDLAPDSATDRAKLKAIEEEIVRKAARGTIGAHSNGSISGPLPSGTQNIAGLAPTTWLKLIWVGFVVFVIVVVILVVPMRNRGKELPLGARGTIQSGDGTSSDVIVDSPAGTLKRPSRANPFPLLGSKQQNSQIPASVRPNLPTRPQPRDASVSGVGVSEREGALQARMAAQIGGTSGTTLGPITVDPREQRASIVLIEHTTAQTIQPSEGAPDALHDQALRDAYQAAVIAFGADSELQRATVYVRAAFSNATPMALFAGDIDRRAVERGGNAPEGGQLLSAFTGTWWAPPDSVRESPNDGSGQQDR